jgi:hypothetical protein
VSCHGGKPCQGRLRTPRSPRPGRVPPLPTATAWEEWGKQANGIRSERQPNRHTYRQIRGAPTPSRKKGAVRTAEAKPRALPEKGIHFLLISPPWILVGKTAALSDQFSQNGITEVWESHFCELP